MFVFKLSQFRDQRSMSGLQCDTEIGPVLCYMYSDSYVAECASKGGQYIPRASFFEDAPLAELMYLYLLVCQVRVPVFRL